MKNLKKLQGAKVLSKDEQKAVKGGILYCKYEPCPPGYECIGNGCYLVEPTPW